MREPRVREPGIEIKRLTRVVAETKDYDIYEARWPSIGSIHGEGLLLAPKVWNPEQLPAVIAIPDAEASLSPEEAAAAVDGAVPRASLNEALTSLDLKPGDRVLICGSLYLAGWVLAQ